MGIRDRDYMKRPSDAEGKGDSPPDSKAEEFFAHFLRKHPRFFLYVAVGFGVLIVLGLLIVKFSGPNH
jgi:hypothetical protein